MMECRSLRNYADFVEAVADCKPKRVYVSRSYKDDCFDLVKLEFNTLASWLEGLHTTQTNANNVIRVEHVFHTSHNAKVPNNMSDSRQMDRYYREIHSFEGSRLQKMLQDHKDSGAPVSMPKIVLKR